MLHVRFKFDLYDRLRLMNDFVAYSVISGTEELQNDICCLVHQLQIQGHSTTHSWTQSYLVISICLMLLHAFSHLITSDSFKVTWLKFSSLGCGRFLTSFISSFPRSTAPISPGNSDSLSLLQERDPKMNSTVERLVQRKFNVIPTFPKQQRNMNI